MIIFLKKVILFLFPLVLFFIVPTVSLFLGREHFSVGQIVEIQKKHSDALFGFVYNDQSFIPYKQALVESNNPEIITLGTSRVMQLRKEFFKNQTTFINAGGGAKSLIDVRQFIQNISSTSSVKIILLGLDQDMFTDKENLLSYVPEETDYFDSWRKLLFTNTRKIYTDYAHQKYSLKELLGKQDEHSVGIAAIIAGDGFRSDGSYRYGHIILEKNMRARVDKQMKETLTTMKYGRYASFMSSGYEEKNIEVLVSILELAKTKNIEIVGFFPPFPSILYRYMRDNKEYHDTINLLPKHIKQVFNDADRPFFDFSDLGSFRAPDTEFVDNIHASDKMYVRMLIVMVENTPSLKKYIDVKLLSTMLDTYKEDIFTY